MARLLGLSNWEVANYRMVFGFPSSAFLELEIELSEVCQPLSFMLEELVVSGVISA